MSHEAAFHSSSASVVHLLWTGGWDSTYRLLDLVLVQGLSVQPHYVLDPGRGSRERELQAMEEIRRAVARGHPGAGERILPTRFTRLEDIREDAEITRKLKGLRRRGRLGDQYGWLARYALQEALSELELALEKGDTTARHFDGNVVLVERSLGRSCWRIREELRIGDLGLFDHFRFPVLHLSKRKMGERARAAGFAAILELTWFCHRPVQDRPCGVCHPCRLAVRKKMGYRLPLAARFRGRMAEYRERREALRVRIRAGVGRVLRRIGLRA